MKLVDIVVKKEGKRNPDPDEDTELHDYSRVQTHEGGKGTIVLSREKF